MFKFGQKIKCINDSGANPYLVAGNIYTYVGMSKEPEAGNCLIVGEYPENKGGDGWFVTRFVKHDDQQDFERFMDRVMKPVNTDQPVTA